MSNLMQLARKRQAEAADQVAFWVRVSETKPDLGEVAGSELKFWRRRFSDASNDIRGLRRSAQAERA